MRWIAQTNLGRNETRRIERACKKLNLEFVPIEAIPFVDHLPDLPEPNKPTVFYGATIFIDTVYRKYSQFTPGTFFNPLSVCPTWLSYYGSSALAFENCRLTTIRDISEGKWDWPDPPYSRTQKSFKETTHIFIRPYSDGKAFPGQVTTLEDVDKWANSLMVHNIDVLDIPVIVTPAYNLTREWRLFMVDGKMSSGAMYRKNQRLAQDDFEVPQSIVEFGEEQAKIYSPARVYTMDICECGGVPYILEVGCFNSSGFYAADVKKIISDISDLYKGIDYV